MVRLLKRAAAPVVRLATAQPVAHEHVFETFAANIGRALVAEAVRREPRIVSFEKRRSR